MSWAVFVWTVLPTGGVLAAMLASGKSLAMRAASKVLSAPVRMGNLQLSIASIMTGFCMTLALLSYSALRRCEARVEQQRTPLVLQDQQMRDVFHQGRNLYLSLLGLSLWGTAWRLKALYDAKQLGPPQGHRGQPRSPITRGICLALGLLFLLLADVPLCRINYNLQLAAFVTPKKARLLATSAPPCEGVMLSAAGGKCAEFCEEAQKLSEDRLGAIMWARNWHILGRLAAEVFDLGRGMEQGSGRIEDLFAKKTCAEVLRSVDKSNQTVNLMCIFLAALSFIGAFTAFANAGQHNHSHED